MFEQLADVLFLALSSGLLFAVAAVGVLALPWKDDELVDTTRAVRHSWRRLDHALRRLDPRTSAPARLEMRLDAPSVVLEPPTA